MSRRKLRSHPMLPEYGEVLSEETNHFVIYFYIRSPPTLSLTSSLGLGYDVESFPSTLSHNFIVKPNVVFIWITNTFPPFYPVNRHAANISSFCIYLLCLKLIMLKNPRVFHGSLSFDKSSLDILVLVFIVSSSKLIHGF